MQKEDFMKEVTALFSASKFHDLDAFLRENKKHTVENKKVIKNLNKQLGQPFITATITTVEKEEKEAYKQSIKSIESAVENNDSVALFNALKPLSFNEQYSSEITMKFYYNDELFNMFFKNIIDNRTQLNEQNQENLRVLCLQARLNKIEDLGLYYCNSTNNVDDSIAMLKNKVHTLVQNQKKSNEEKVEIVNQLCDLMTEHKNDVSTHFSQNAEQYVYLNKANIIKVEDKSGALESEKLVRYLANWNLSALNYYLAKQDKDLQLEIDIDLYLSLINKVDTDKLFISKESTFTNEQFEERIKYNPRFVLKIVSDEKFQNFLSEKGYKFTFADSEKYPLINQVLYELNKNEVDSIFNKSTIFNLTEKQKSVVQDYLTNHEVNIIKTINHEKDMPRNIGERAMSEYVQTNINDGEFIQKLNATGKKNMINGYIDYSKIEDGQKFINDFLVDLPKEQYSCFHNSLSNCLEGNKNQTAIMSYLLNEKTDFTSHSVYHSVEMFHLLNDEKKKEMVGNILKQKNERNHFQSYYQQMDKHSNSAQEKLNLKEVKSLYDSLLAEKEYAIKQHKKYKKLVS